MKWFLRWCLDHWYLLFLGAAAVAVLLATGGKRKGLLEKTQREIKAINAKRDARNLTLDHGAVQATAKVKAKYAAKKEALAGEERERVDQLERMHEEDPERLAAELARALL